jgi:restriction system protein
MVLALLLLGIVLEPTRYAAMAALAAYVGSYLVPVPGAAERAALRSARRKLDALVRRHEEVLARKYLATVRRDDYGLLDDGEWRKALAYFRHKLVTPVLSGAESAALDSRRNGGGGGDGAGEGLLTASMLRRIRARAAAIERTLELSDDIDPIDFEHWCAARLRAAGWSARRTKGSGDQGGDVIAEKGGVRLVVQAKRHQAPVGNKAVQEVYAAARHFGARHAVVVGTAGFTKAAMELADSTGVLLLNASDLDRLEALLPDRQAASRPPARPRRAAQPRPAARR